MQLFRDLALGKIKVPQNTIISTIPIYNIGGALKKFDYKRIKTVQKYMVLEVTEEIMI
jgi:hypothetical protein